MRKIMLAAALAIGMNLASAKDYTLKNIRQNVEITTNSKGEQEISCPIVKDYSEVKSAVEDLYSKITGENLTCCHIIVVDEEEMKGLVKRFKNLDTTKSYSGIHYGDSIAAKEGNLLMVLNDIGHELGHKTFDRFKKRYLNNDERLVEEAKAMAFSEMWNGRIEYCIKGKISTSWKKDTDLLYPAATKLLNEICKTKNGKEAYEALKTEPVNLLVAKIRETAEYKSYIESRIKF